MPPWAYGGTARVAGHYDSDMELNVLRVFLGPEGAGGNLLGVFLDGTGIAPERRQVVALELGYSETVFVDEVHDGSAHVAIFTPARELPFAGHPTVGTSWFLAERGQSVDVLHCKAGDVATWQEDGATWVRAPAMWAPDFDFRELASVEAVDTFDPPRIGEPGVYVWAWEDEAAGRIRARSFPTDLGIAEDEATGAAAVVMGSRLGRPLVIRQGTGSEIVARPGPDGMVEIGGRTAFVERRPFA
jgi:predicted PhzF superfamily epimerase YddE/YHI9